MNVDRSRSFANESNRSEPIAIARVRFATTYDDKDGRASLRRTLVHHGDTLIWIDVHHHYRSTSTMVEIILVFQSLRSKRSDIIQIVRLIKSSQRSYVVFRYCTRYRYVIQR